MTTWNEMTETEQLGCIYSDSHKEVFGFRPRHMTPEQLASVEWLKNAIAKLDEMPLDYDNDDDVIDLELADDPIGDAETDYDIEFEEETDPAKVAEIHDEIVAKARQESEERFEEINDGANGYDDDPEDDGQPSEYEEWQDYFGGDEYYDHSENEIW